MDKNEILSKLKEIKPIYEKEGLIILGLFGSYAKESAKQDSDIDVYVETENLTLKKEVSLIDSKINVKIGKYNKSSNLIKEIEKNHAVIKGVEKYYEKTTHIRIEIYEDWILLY